MSRISRQIQNVIRAYGQRVNKGSLARVRPSLPQSVTDSITISSEAKNKQIADKVASEIISRVTGKNSEEMLNYGLVDRLGAELGGKLDISSDKEKRGGFRFRVVDPEKGEVIKELNTEDLQQVVSRIKELNIE